MDTMRGALERARMLVGMEVDEESAPEEQSFFDDRLYGFAICLAAGLTCTFLSMLVFFNPVKFGVTFTLGNLMALGRWGFNLLNYVYINVNLTAFLIGPKRQFDMMLDSVRIYATAVYIASIIIALFCALFVHSKLLTLLAIILEFGALVWYSLSYIPFARSVVSKVMTSCFDTEF
uniref:Vesicle transport protein n=1 Tax=Oryza nivara TaxID=4536 RepID=A0A0E0G8F5_ORYNI